MRLCDLKNEKLNILKCSIFSKTNAFFNKVDYRILSYLYSQLLSESTISNLYMHCYVQLLVVVIASLNEFAFDVFPQLSLVVILVPLGHSNVKRRFESECTSKDGSDENGISLKKTR